MKVSGSKRREAALSPAKGDSKRGVGVRHGAFLEALQAAEALSSSPPSVEESFEPVEAAAKALKESPTFENLTAYKRALREFLSRILGEAYVVQHVRVLTRRGRPSVSVLVRTLDAHLDELARLVLSGTRDALAIAAKIDDIRGLIFDYIR